MSAPYEPSSPYEQLVARATDEQLPTEDWQVNLDLCDRVQSDGATGAHQALAAVTARLQHPSAQVQLYALTLADMLGKNVPGPIMYPEMSNPTFCGQLNRMAHDTANVSTPVRTRLLALIKEWDADLTKAGLSNTLLQDTYASLKSQNLDIGSTEPATGDDAEDEELKRVLALSLQDQGGRSQWSSGYFGGASGAGAGGTAGAGGSAIPNASSSTAAQPSHNPTSANNPFLSQAQAQGAPASSAAPSGARNSSQPQLVDVSPAGASGPPMGTSAAATAAAAALGTAAPLTATPHQAQGSASPSSSAPGAAGTAQASAASATAGPAASSSAPPDGSGEERIVSSRVRALYDFSSAEPGELNFQAGDIIRVLDTVYEHWWRGEVKGQVGIFPVNHVEILPNPTPDDLARDATMEVSIFAQSTSIDALAHKLATLDPAQPVSAQDKSELEGIFGEASTVAPKLNELIDRYEAKLAELRGLSGKYEQARVRYAQVVQGAPSGAGPASSAPASAPVGAGSAAPEGPRAGAGAGKPSEPAPAYGAEQAQAQAQTNPQPPPGMDVTSPEYAEWYYRTYPQMAPQQ